MQSVHTRMRRAVEKENQDIVTKTAGRKKSKRNNPPRRQRFNLCLALLVLSPVLIIGAFIFTVKQYAMWSQAEADPENSTPGKIDATKHHVDSLDADANQPKRLRNRGNVRIHDNENKMAEARQKRKRNLHKQTGADEKPKDTKDRPQHKFLVLTTKHGNIKITLRPDLSQGSVDYIHKLVESYGGKRCMHCNFYRAEKPGILQGIMEHKDVVPVNTVLGSCPPGAEGVKNDCPEWDKHCGCHGPVMTRGAVAWAAGQAGGPDFFIDAYPNPADWWGTQHTNFGFIEDEASLKLIDSFFELPIESTPDMTFLKDSIHFDLVLE